MVLIGALQRAAVLWAEGDPDAVHLWERALLVRGRFGTRTELVLPLGVRYRDGTERIFALHRDKSLDTGADGSRVPTHWDVVREIAHRSGYKCEVLTDVQLDRWSIRMENAAMLAGHVRAAHDSPDAILLTDVLAGIPTDGGVTLSDLLTGFAPDRAGDVRSMVAALLHDGRVAADLDRKRFAPFAPLRRLTDASS